MAEKRAESKAKQPRPNDPFESRLTALPYPVIIALRISNGAPMPTSGSNPEPVP
jgi:hypothetical protein